MSTLTWQSFDADEPNPAMEQAIRALAKRLLAEAGVDPSDTAAALAFARRQVSTYKGRSNPSLNETVAVDVFRPHEFDSDTTCDASLQVLLTWFETETFDWERGSKSVVDAINSNFASVGSRVVEGGRENVILDCRVRVGDRDVAVEVETSNNLDNGFWTLRQAVRTKKADYGIMIVPWTAGAEGRADEGKALGRLDREFDGASDLRDGPVFRVAIVRKLDVYRVLLANNAWVGI